MADQTNTPAASTAKKPRMVQMPRAVHELRTGPDAEDVIEAGTVIDDDLAKKHKLTATVIKDLTERGAIDTTEALTA